mgnify:CR=1 FL=1
MKTRFTSLVKLKKNTMQKSEQSLQEANINLNSAKSALNSSYDSLEKIEVPRSGNMAQMLASRAFFESQRDIINHNKKWVEFALNQVNKAKKQLKADMMEHEKFQYLELQEIKQEIKKKKLKEAKDLDEIALMTYNGKPL